MASSSSNKRGFRSSALSGPDTQQQRTQKQKQGATGRATIFTNEAGLAGLGFTRGRRGPRITHFEQRKTVEHMFTICLFLNHPKIYYLSGHFQHAGEVADSGSQTRDTTLAPSPGTRLTCRASGKAFPSLLKFRRSSCTLTLSAFREERVAHANRVHT